MASSVPSPESFIESFPNSIPKIEGTPDFESLSTIRHLIKANAATVPSNNGGGQHGYLGISTSSAIYATISPTAFTIPPNPGPQPILPAGNATAAQISHAIKTNQKHKLLLDPWFRHFGQSHRNVMPTPGHAVPPAASHTSKYHGRIPA